MLEGDEQTARWVRLFCANPECSPSAHDIVHENAHDYLMEHEDVNYPEVFITRDGRVTVVPTLEQ